MCRNKKVFHFFAVLLQTIAWIFCLDCLHTGNHLQHHEHTGADPQGHEDQPHQPFPYGDCRGRHDGHVGLHSLCCAHVPPPCEGQKSGGKGLSFINLLRVFLTPFLLVFLQLGPVPLVPQQLLDGPAHGLHLVHPGAGCLEADHDQVPHQGRNLLHFVKVQYPPCTRLWYIPEHSKYNILIIIISVVPLMLTIPNTLAMSVQGMTTTTSRGDNLTIYSLTVCKFQSKSSSNKFYN